MLRHGCSIGAGAVVVAGIDVGRFATVGAGAVVTKAVPDNALVAGNPARRLGWVCDCGQRLTDSRPARPSRPARTPMPTCSCAACDRHYVRPRREQIRDAAPAVSPAVRQGVKA